MYEEGVGNQCVLVHAHCKGEYCLGFWVLIFSGSLENGCDVSLQINTQLNSGYEIDIVTRFGRVRARSSASFCAIVVDNNETYISYV